jgi:transposase
MEHRLRSISNDAWGDPQSDAPQYFGVQPLQHERVTTADVAAMAKAYSMALKQQMVARLTGVNAPSAAQLARETGITQQNLSRWLSEARNRPFAAPGNDILSAWTAEQKAQIIVQSGGLTGDELSRYLEGEDVRLAHFRRWRLALEEAGEEFVGMRKRIAKLERELIRKEKALAEAATLLLLREAVENQFQEEDHSIDKKIEEQEELSCSMSTCCASDDNPVPPPARRLFAG